MDCPECALPGFDVLPGYGPVTKKQSEKPGCRVRAGEFCQTCLKARFDYFTPIKDSAS